CGRCEARDGGAGGVETAAGDDDLETGVAGEALADESPEGAVAADHEHLGHSACPFELSPLRCQADGAGPWRSRKGRTWAWKAAGASTCSMCETPGISTYSEPAIALWITCAAAGGV